jgi:hypothetical protein
MDGTAFLGTAVLGVVKGQIVATYTTSSLPLGSHSLSAVYSGDKNFLTSTSSLLQQSVGKYGTTTTLVSSAPSSVFRQSIVLTATVRTIAPGVGTPTGTVTFKYNGSPLGTGTLGVVNGQVVATLTTASIGVGIYSLTAVYNGDPVFNISISSTVTQVVAKGGTTTTLAASSTSPSLGELVTLTATIAAISPSAGTETGTVTFMDGTTVLGTGMLSVVKGKIVATYSTSSLSLGAHSLTAVYNGDNNFATSTSSAITVTVT